jgi:hypothetical protein
VLHVSGELLLPQTATSFDVDVELSSLLIPSVLDMLTLSWGTENKAEITLSSMAGRAFENI